LTLPSRAAQAAILIGTMAIQVVATAATLAFPVLVPAVPGATSAGVGVFITAVYLGAMLGAMGSGSIVSRFGPVRSSQLALLMQGAALAMLATGHPLLRLVGALMVGLAYGPITPASSQILARTTPPDRMGFVFSVKQTGVPLGGLAAGLLLPLATVSSWRTSLLSLAASALVVALVCNPLHRRLDEPASQVKRSGNVRQLLGTILRHRGLRSIAAVSLLFAVCQLSLGGYLVIYLHQEVGLSLVDAGIVYAIAQGAGVVGRLIWGRIADATGQPNTVMLVIAVLMGASAVGTGLLGPQWSMASVCIMAALFGGTAIGWNGVFLGEVARLAPPNSGVAAITGGVLSFTYVGVMVGPLLFGHLGQGLGSLGAAFMSLAVVTAVAMVLLARVRRPPV